MASVIHPGLYLIIERFPDHRNVFRRLHTENDCFRSLCESYRQCAAALTYWTQSNQAVALDRQHEYNELLHDLEGEILQYGLDDRCAETPVR